MSKVTIQNLKEWKSDPAQKRKIVTVTAYDYTFAKLVDEWADIVLVGDSLGMVIQGRPNTLGVKIEDVIYHTKAVAAALKHAHLVADMPFMTYQTSIKEAVRNAGLLLSEGGAEAVKLEGGTAISKTVAKLVHFGIPVMGHVGLTPQSVHQFGGFKIQGRTEQARHAILQDALALEDAGVYSIVLEGMPADLAAEISERVDVPTIGIGAGAQCDGQVLVIQDLLGMNPDFQPKFVKQFANLSGIVTEAMKSYADDVRDGRFPTAEHSF